MKALSDLKKQTATNLVCLFCDIDDTISSEGRISAQAYDAIWRATDSGLHVVPVTGRPAGWCDHIARMWPVHGVIGENGGFVFRMQAGTMERHFIYDDQTRAEFRRKLLGIKTRILSEVTGCGIASDQNYREYDLAIDFCEDVTPLSREDVLRIKRIFDEMGATAKISSIHVNGWFGDFDKLSTAKSYMQEHFNLDADLDRDRCAFAGDSPNDEPMFSWFSATSFGVANVLDFSELITHQPAFITPSRSGKGFVELVNTILDLRD
jgi:HAD superfamily hydrolase (TIGR01484 family)